MKGDCWVTRGGVVVEQIKPTFVVLSKGKWTTKVPCRRVSTGGFHGALRLDRLRPATRHEVRVARSAA